MNIAFYNGVSGLVTFQNEMDILSHNIANVNTNGYKAFRGMFKELLPKPRRQGRRNMRSRSAAAI